MFNFNGVTLKEEKIDGINVIYIYADENESKNFDNKKEALEYYLLALTTPTESDYEEAGMLEAYKEEVKAVKDALKEL